MRYWTGSRDARARGRFPLVLALGVVLGALAPSAGADVINDPPATVKACVLLLHDSAPGMVFTVSVSESGRPLQTLSVPSGGCATATVPFYSEVTLAQTEPGALTIQVDPPDRLVSADTRAARVTVKTGDYGDKVGVTFTNDCRSGNGFGDTKHCRPR